MLTDRPLESHPSDSGWLIELGLAPGLHHFVSLFRDATASYLKTLVGKRKPRAIIACMLYCAHAAGLQPAGTSHTLCSVLPAVVARHIPLTSPPFELPRVLRLGRAGGRQLG